MKLKEFLELIRIKRFLEMKNKEVKIKLRNK